MSRIDDERGRDEGAEMMFGRKRFAECSCIAVEYGGCRCDDDGTVTHGGCERERQDHQSEIGGRQRVSS